VTQHHLETSYPYVRGIYCNRTLNLRTIQAIGYDMDYTLIHYNVDAWEGKAYDYIKQGLLRAGFPVEDLQFDPDSVIRGLIIDKKLGNIVKVNRFGYIKHASHGTKMLSRNELREAYNRTIVDLSNSRYFFLNTLFSISEACIYSQLVDLRDEDKLPGVWGYVELFELVRNTLDNAHIEGELKADIMAHPERYVELDPDTPPALLDQKMAGKKMLLITNSEWEYTRFMMDYAFNPFLPDGMTWRELFDIIVVSAGKPDFFTLNRPMFEVVNEEGLLKPLVGPMEEGKIYLGGSATRVEKSLGIKGDTILYVGDHIYGDVNVSKKILRWRTAIVLHELEREFTCVEHCQLRQVKVNEMMARKVRMEDEFSQLRLQLLRNEQGYGPQSDDTPEELKQRIADFRAELVEMDREISALVSEIGTDFNSRWGYLMRTGNDKSHLTHQVEQYADIYMSRVSNFLRYTPFMFFRSPRGSLPHDMGASNSDFND
jgi:HAD superfamily 5'-nucleotidase-like hydrolase